MKSGIKHFILKIELSTRTLLVHSLITLVRLLFPFRYLASGNTFVDLHYSYRLGKKTIQIQMQIQMALSAESKVRNG